MKTIETVDLLAGFAAYLADEQLAQWSPTFDYLEDPGRPAVLFAGADVPDTALVLTVTGYDPRVGEFDVALAFRAPGNNPILVETHADSVYSHFASTMGPVVGVIESGTVVALPYLEWNDLVISNVERMTRGNVELTSPSKNKGTRYTRTDTYRVLVDRDE
ncbi:hypothetical protein SAMN04488583_6374 [Mycobacterium sp. 88mf]|nr:hypothetical protein SAMN04488583_6374 [Mycobacterium sp. 88mf]SFG61515.1 hypothetical protein SAMN04488582_11075 [Mycobacterium sp. 455mf]